MTGVPKRVALTQFDTPPTLPFGWGWGGDGGGPGNLVSNSKFSPTGFVELGWGLAEELEKSPNLVEEGVQAPCPQPRDIGGI